MTIAPGVSVMLSRQLLPVLALLACFPAAFASEQQGNQPDKVKPIPPPGVKIADADRAELQKGVEELGKEIEDLRRVLKGKQAQLALLPDVQIFFNAVHYALRY